MVSSAERIKIERKTAQRDIQRNKNPTKENYKRVNEGGKKELRTDMAKIN
jgi:hypothetical protein